MEPARAASFAPMRAAAPLLPPGKSQHPRHSRRVHLILMTSAVDRQVPILVVVKYNRYNSSQNPDVSEMMLVDPYETSLDSLHSKIKYTFFKSTNYSNGGNLPALNREEKDGNDSIQRCRMKWFNRDLELKIHNGNIKSILMALASDVPHGYLSVHFGPSI
ncbi:hypothetical protein MMC15_007209 [Xylographa vitiligo]|nr:hypothetical protein [Xylographa vitiligo]